MKKRGTILILFAVCCLWQSNSNAQCDATNDFVQWGDSNWYDIDIPNDNRPDNVGQTFIATCTGPIRGTTLVTDNVRGGNIGGVSMTAELWLNPFSSSRVLMASQTQDINFHPIEGSDEEDYFPFTSLPQVTAGTEYAVVFTLNDTQYTVGVDVQLSNWYPEGNFIRDWSTTGTGSWDLRTRVHYEDNVAPNAICKNITRALGANNTVSINASNINNGSNDADSGIATYQLSKSTFDCNDVGYNSVRLIVTDQNGNSSACESVVWITDGNDPVLTCPGDMTVTADYQTGTAIVNYADVTYDDCTFEWADGFDFIGTHDGRSYFVSHTPLVPSEAFANAELQGGHVTTVIDAEHNEWLRDAVNNQGLTNEDILIGYNDIVEEDTFVWHNPNGGSTYDNWATLEPNNAGGIEDYTIMNGGGRWNDVNNNTARNYILEKSEANIRQSSGLASGSEFPVGTTINYFSATDAFGNTGECFFIVEVLPAPIETTVVLDNGELIITDVLSESSDQITFSSDGTTLTISDLIDPSVSGGPTLVDLTTVTVPLASITNGIVFNSGNGSNTGFNIITFANDLTLTGVDNDITLNGLRGYVQTGSINIEGDLTINGVGFGLTHGGFDLTLGEITANNFTIDGVDRILDQELALTISGVTLMQAGDGINIENGQGRHTFGGEVNLTSGELIFSATGNTTFGEINATDQGVGLPHTFTVAPAGDITFNGDVTILGSNANLFVCGLNSISQTGGSIETPFLVFRGNGNTSVTIDNNNNIGALGTSNPFDANAVDLASLSFTNTSNMFLEDIDVDEFNLTAPQFDIEPDFTKITKRGSGVSNFNADIDMNNGTGTAIFNHIAGTINFNGDTNDFLSQMTYIGQPGTITNINSVTTNFPFAGTNRGFIFGTLNATGAIDAGDIDINLSDGANFSLNTTSLTGVPYVQGALTTISGGAQITPGGGTTGLEYSFDDLIMNSGATFAPFIEGTGVSEFDKLLVNGTLTLDDANLAPTGGYVIGPDDELIIIDNDGTDDAVVGTFNDLPEGREVVFGDFVGMISYMGGDGNDVVLIPLLDTEVNLTDGTLTIEDINGGLSNDDITLSNDGTTLIISDLIAPVKIVGAVTPVTETSVSVPLASITNGFQFLSEGGVDSITIDDALTLSGSDNFFIADNIDNYTQNAALTVGGTIWLSGTDTSNILFGEITASNLNLIEFNNVDDSDGKRLNISGQVSMRTLGTVNIDNGSGNESDHFFGGLVDIEAALVSNFTTGSDLSISIRTTATDGINNIITSSDAITFSGISTTAGDSDLNVSATTSITQLADATITTDELIITANAGTTVALLKATNDINLLTTNSLIFGLSITDVDDLELGTITVDEFTITAPTINMTSETDFTKIGVGVGNFVGFSFSNGGTGSITQSGGTIIFNGDTVLFGGITYNGLAGTTTKFTGGQTFIGNNFTFGTLLAEDRFVIESGLVTVLNETIVGNDDGPDITKIFGGYGTFTGGSPTTISTNGEILPFEFGSLTFENDLRIENGGKFTALLGGTELDDYSRINVTGTVTLDNAELSASFNILNSLVGPGFELVIIDNDGVDPIVGTFNGYPEGAMLVASVGGTIKTGTLSYSLGTGNDFGWKYDDVAPTAVCQDITLNVGLGGITVTGDQLDGGATDNTEITEILIDGEASLSFTSADIGDHVVTVTFADTNGNSAECMATITLISTECVDTTTYTGGTWNNGAPDSNTHAIIAENYSTSIDNIEACSLTVNSGVILTIGAGEYIEIQGDITIDGTLTVAHEGSVVQVREDGLCVNNGFIEVLVSTPDLASRDFMILGSPMTGESRNDVYASSFLVLDHNTANFVPHPDVAALFPMAENFADDNYDNWSNYSGAISPGAGYIVRPQAGYGEPGGVFNFTHDTGTLNNGVVNFDVVFNTEKNDSPNVLSNPYPSAISADAFINANSMVGEVYFWEHLTPPSNSLPGAGAMNFSMEDISMYNLMGGTAATADPTGIDTQPNGIISTSQGFGIKATAAGMAEFNNSMRVLDGNTTLRFHSPENGVEKDRIWLTIQNDTYNLQNSTLIGFSEITTPSIDHGYDSRRLATVLSLFSEIDGSDEELGIQSREAFYRGIKVPIGFSSLVDEDTEYSISIGDLEGVHIELATVYLYDNELNITTNLSEAGVYSFQSGMGTFNRRFTLFFEADVLSNENFETQKVTVFPNPAKDVIEISAERNGVRAIEIMDIHGRMIQFHTYNGENTCLLSVSNLPTGVYFLTVSTNSGQVVKRLLKE